MMAVTLMMSFASRSRLRGAMMGMATTTIA
jgi:hypothetical protein